jgi:hypothetical protein
VRTPATSTVTSAEPVGCLLVTVNWPSAAGVMSSSVWS